MLSRWNILTVAPHRVMFFGGLLQLLLALLWWGAQLGSWYLGFTAPPTPVYATWAHAWLMFFGLFPFLIFGFLMTTYPRWMNGPQVPRPAYLRAFGLMALGLALFWAGLVTWEWLMLPGVLLHAAGFAAGTAALINVYRRVGPTRDRRYEWHLNHALLFGVAADLLYGLWLGTGVEPLRQASLLGAFWLFLLPVLILVGHRMIPYFTSSVVRDYRLVQPGWSFRLVWVAVTLHVTLELAGARSWLFVADLPLLFLAVHHAWHWGVWRARDDKLLLSLHLAFWALPLGLALYVVQSLWLLLAGEPILGRAPLHAIAIGFLGGMVVAMVTRVSRGHSGRELRMDRLDWYSFVATLVAAVLRVLAETGVAAAFAVGILSMVSLVVWLLALLPWVVRLLFIHLSPRLDGKPG